MTLKIKAFLSPLLRFVAILIAAATAIFLSGAAALDGNTAPESPDLGCSMKLGAIYWNGFGYTGAQYTDRLLKEFPDRKPIWGWTSGTVENMEYQIELAARAGINYFAFDYYPADHMKAMNSCVDKFIGAKNNGKLEFCLYICDHEGAFVYYDDWFANADKWVEYMKNPQYLKVDGKAVLFIYTSYEKDMARLLGGVEKVNECFDYLRDKAVQAGLGGVYIIGTLNPYGDSLGGIDYSDNNVTGASLRARMKAKAAEGWDAFTNYNSAKREIRNVNDCSYAIKYTDQTANQVKVWNAFSDNSPIPYVPLVLSGWDRRPYESKPEERMCYSPDRTPTAYYRHIIEAADWLRANPASSLGKLAIVYAWNEYGEGGYIAPTVGTGGEYLAATAAAMLEISADNLK